MRLVALTATVPFPAPKCSMVGYQTVEAKGLASSKLQSVRVTELFEFLTVMQPVALFTHDAGPGTVVCLVRSVIPVFCMISHLNARLCQGALEGGFLPTFLSSFSGGLEARLPNSGCEATGACFSTNSTRSSNLISLPLTSDIYSAPPLSQVIRQPLHSSLQKRSQSCCDDQSHSGCSYNKSAIPINSAEPLDLLPFQ